MWPSHLDKSLRGLCDIPRVPIFSVLGISVSPPPLILPSASSKLKCDFHLSHLLGNLGQGINFSGTQVPYL